MSGDSVHGAYDLITITARSWLAVHRQNGQVAGVLLDHNTEDQWGNLLRGGPRWSYQSYDRIYRTCGGVDGVWHGPRDGVLLGGLGKPS